MQAAYKSVARFSRRGIKYGCKTSGTARLMGRVRLPRMDLLVRRMFDLGGFFARASMCPLSATFGRTDHRFI